MEEKIHELCGSLSRLLFNLYIFSWSLLSRPVPLQISKKLGESVGCNCI